MDSNLLLLLIGYLSCLIFSAFSALVDLLTAKADNKMYFRKIIKKILERIDENA